MVEPTIVLIRHAQSEWNASGRWQGHADPPLSELGREQAGALARALDGEGLEQIVASDLTRAASTAQFLADPRGLEVRRDAAWRELDIGSWAGLTRDEIGDRDGERLARFDAGELDVRPGDGESRRALQHRATTAVRNLVRAHPERRVAVVTHLGVIRALLPGVRPDNAEWCRLVVSDLPREVAA